MRKVYLYGHLAEQFGPMFELSVLTAGEALRALSANFPTFVGAMKEGSYEVIRGEPSEFKGLWIGLEDVNEFKLGQADLHIVPCVTGSKNSGGIIKVVLGVALIGAALFFSGGALAAPIMGGGGLLGGFTYGNLAMIGLSLALAGVSQLLTPKQKTEEGKNDESFTISGPGNAYDQGNPIPLIYGEGIFGSQLISGGIDIENIPIGWDPTKGEQTPMATIGTTTSAGTPVVSGDPDSYEQLQGNT